VRNNAPIQRVVPDVQFCGIGLFRNTRFRRRLQALEAVGSVLTLVHQKLFTSCLLDSAALLLSLKTLVLLQIIFAESHRKLEMTTSWATVGSNRTTPNP
jgi:hypothetical protein